MGNAAFSEVENDVRLFVLQRRVPLPCAFPLKANTSGRSKCLILVVTLSRVRVTFRAVLRSQVGAAVLAVGLGDEGAGEIRVCVEP